MRILIMVHLLGLRLLHATHGYVERQRVRARSERGSVTIENALWAVAVIAIVAIVVAAITGYVNTQAGKLQ